MSEEGAFLEMLERTASVRFRTDAEIVDLFSRPTCDRPWLDESFPEMVAEPEVFSETEPAGEER